MPRRTRTTSFTLAFGERMRSLRLDCGLSLSQLATTSGISKGHLSSIELGFAAITTESVYRIAVALEVSPMLFFAFPAEDELAATVDIIRRLPTTHLKRLRKIARRWLEEIEREQ